MLKVSFYSYKGGSGRSTTAWNTIQQLVEIMNPTKEHPFVIVDTDTQSAGATFLFKAAKLFMAEKPYWSVQKRMVDKPEDDYDGTDPDVKKKFFSTMYPIGTFFGKPVSEKESVLLIGANTVQDSASATNADVAGKGGAGSQQMDNFRNGITFACEDCGVKALFFDTPSGSQFLAKMSIQQSDVVVCCMRPTRQFREGTYGQLIKFLEDDVKFGEDVQRKYILTPTAVCVDQKQRIGSEEYPLAAYEDIKKLFSAENMETDKLKEAFKNSIVLDMLTLKSQTECENSVEEIFGIPEIKRFKWFEECLGALPDGELSKNDKMALKRYNLLAQTIKKFWKEDKEE